MKYAFDTNIFIDAYRSFYAMDIAPLYWKILSKFIESNEFYLIDKVYNEILRGKGALSDWIMNQSNIKVYKTNNSKDLLDKYSYVMNSVASMPEYNEDAIKKWDDKDVADPWIISVALLEKSTIVTHETRVFGGIRQESKKIKLPDVAKKFNVECINLFEFMREEKIIIG